MSEIEAWARTFVEGEGRIIGAAPEARVPPAAMTALRAWVEAL